MEDADMDCACDFAVGDDPAAVRRRLETVLDAVIDAGLAAKGVSGLNAVLRAVKLKADLAGLLGRPARRPAASPPDPEPPVAVPEETGGPAPDPVEPTVPALVADPPETIVPSSADGGPPVLVYRGVLRGTERKAAAVRRRFAAHGWGGGGRVGDLSDPSDPPPDRPEALAFLRGRVRLELGRGRGAMVDLGAGDVCVVPAGTPRHCLEATGDLAVVTCHPPANGDPARPPDDPLTGAGGPLGRLWPGG
jgi:uncharacterized protein YjlB